MTGVIKVNKLEGRSTAGSLVVTGEGNSTTTNLQQGLAAGGMMKKKGMASGGLMAAIKKVDKKKNGMAVV